MDVVVFMLVVLAQVLWSIWAGIDAMLHPDAEWRAAGLSRALTLVMLVMTCTLGTLVYFTVIRPRLVRALRAD